MARIRSDKPEAYQSETLAEISLAAERTFKGMATIADDRGRLADKPAQINGELWSMRGNHTRDDLEAELAEMIKVDLVCRYVGCDGKRYLHMVSWDRHQKIDRPSKSRIPRCPVHQAEDACLHENACIPPEISPDPPGGSRVSREGSRVLQQAQNGLDAVADADSRIPQGELVTITSRHDQASGGHTPDLQEQKSSRDSRESSMQDLGPRTVDRGSIPATPDAAKPRRRAKPEDPDRAKNAGDIVAAYVDGAIASGQDEPASSLKARVGRDARQLLSEGKDPEALVACAYRMGTGGWNDLAVQLRKDAAAAAGNGSAGSGRSTGAERAQAAMEAGRRVQAALDERNAS